MGDHAKARVAQEQKIAKVKGELASLEKRKADELQRAAELTKKAAKLAPDAVSGDRRAITEQTALNQKRAEATLQAENLEHMAAPLRAELSAAESDLPNLALAEARESVIQEVEELPMLTQHLASLIAPIAAAFGEFKAKIDSIADRALPLLGDPERTIALKEKLRTVVFVGIRAQLGNEFRRVGLEFFPPPKFGGTTFEGAVGPVLETLTEALEISLASADSPGRKAFRCTTNVGGLFGLNLRAGEIVSLPVDDPDVTRMIEQGALEQVAEEVRR